MGRTPADGVNSAVSVSRYFVVILLSLLVAGTSFAADPLTARDLGWLAGNVSLRADSPVLLDLSDAQKRRLHGLIESGPADPDRRRQQVVDFLTGAVGDSLEEALDRAAQPPASEEIGSLGGK
jgi:hypothetical protein